MNHAKDEQSFLTLKSKIQEHFKNRLFQGFFKNHLQFKNNSRNSRTAGHPEYPTRQLKLKTLWPFYGWGSTASRLQPLQGGSLLFTIYFLQLMNFGEILIPIAFTCSK